MQISDEARASLNPSTWKGCAALGSRHCSAACVAVPVSLRPGHGRMPFPSRSLTCPVPIPVGAYAPGPSHRGCPTTSGSPGHLPLSTAKVAQSVVSEGLDEGCYIKNTYCPLGKIFQFFPRFCALKKNYDNTMSCKWFYKELLKFCICLLLCFASLTKKPRCGSQNGLT